MQLPKLDLHCHTTASDGDLTPHQLIDLAVEKKLELLAITDHDTTAGFSAAKDYVQNLPGKPLQLLSGVEISVLWGAHTIHIVGLSFDVENAELQQLLAQIRELRWQRLEEINHKLIKRGHQCYLEDLHQIVGDGVAGRPHFARALIARGFVQDQNQAFNKFLKQGRPGYAKAIWPELSQAVELIVKAGGIAVMAHPAVYKMSRNKLNLMLQEFRDTGGQGIEVVTSPNRTSDAIGMTDRANRLGLYASLGSDFHSPAHTWRGLGWLAPLPDNAKPITEILKTG